MEVKLALVLVILPAAIGQRNVGEAVVGGLAGALLNTFFPQLKPNVLIQNDNDPPPTAAPIRRPAKPVAGPPGAAVPLALTGLGRLPPVDFPHGYPPTFIDSTNPDKQNGFNIPAGLQGRTDLPPDYVYPFAPPGSIIKPDLNNGDSYSLGPQAAASRQQGREPATSLLSGLLRQNSLQQPADNALLQPIGPSVSLLNSAQFAPSAAGLNAVGPLSGTGRSPGSKAQAGVVPAVPSVQTPKQEVTTQQPPINYGSECPQCEPIDLKKLAGPWIQVYGNPNTLRNIYTAILNLQSLYRGDGEQSAAIQPSCIGMQLSRPQTHGKNRSEAAVDLYFRDDSINRQLHEAVGILKQNPSISPKGVLFKLPAFELPMCLVKSGPKTSTMYGYVVLTETLGTNRCRSYHVFARRSDAFFRDHNVEVAEFIKEQVESNSAQPVSVLPFPELCQITTSTASIISR